MTNNVQENTMLADTGLNFNTISAMLQYNELTKTRYGNGCLLMYTSPITFAANGWITPQELYDKNDRHEYYLGYNYIEVKPMDTTAWRYMFWLYPCFDLMALVTLDQMPYGAAQSLAEFDELEYLDSDSVKEALNPKYNIIDGNITGTLIAEYCDVPLSKFNLSETMIGKNTDTINRFSRLVEIGAEQNFPSGTQGVWDSGGWRYIYGSRIGGEYRWYPWFSYRREGDLVRLLIRCNMMPNYLDESQTKYNYTCFKPFGVHYLQYRNTQTNLFGNYFMVVGVQNL